MSKPTLKTYVATYFAPAARAEGAELLHAIQQITSSLIVSTLLEAVGGVVLVLNAERQIIAANVGALAAFGLSAQGLGEILGLRPGEALGCTQAPLAPSGCGTGMACASCGAVRAMVEAQASMQPVEHECVLRLVRDGAEHNCEYLVRAAPLVLEAHTFTLFVMHDIADKKRRENLERTFFHDLSNTLGALKAYRALALEEAGMSDPALLQRLGVLIDRVVEEVCAHRDLLRAERNAMAARAERCFAREIVSSLQLAFDHHELGAGRQVELDVGTEQLQVDRTLLLRVLTNMLKNALEATPEGGTVTVRCSSDADTVTFSINNPGRLADDVAARIFTRSFSTKAGSGRGLGTYSMKLFSERYLGGTLTFDTGDRGTSFHLRLPRQPAAPAASLTRLKIT